MCLGVFIAQLDSSVVNLAIKPIGGDLHATVSQLQWVVDSYNLVYATFLLTGGTLGDLYGRTRVFVAGIVLIGVGSLICAVAPNAAILVLGRAITGFGAALELPTTLAILTVTYTDATERGRAIGIWASCNGMALAIGPTLGGFLVDVAGWRSIFFLVVPVAALALALALWAVPETSDAEGRRLDPAGQALAIVALGALSFVGIEGPHMGFLNPAILALALICAVSTALFLRVERGRPGALVPLDMFRNVPFSTAITIAGLMTFGMYGMLFLTPLYLQSIGKYSAFAAGIALLPMSITFILVSQFSGALTNRLGARAMTTAGMALMGFGLVVLAFVSTVPDLVLIGTALVVIGAGLGCNTGPVNAVAVANAEPRRSGTASGLINTTRMVGATLGVAVLGSIFAVHAGQGSPEATVTGLRLAFIGGAIGELSGAVLAFAFIRSDSMQQKT
jgi:EmrB/QacA subfamily drug resistance transporter